MNDPIQESLAVLRAALPPIVHDVASLRRLRGRVAIDLEWHEETGALQTIGVGNADLVVQLSWVSVDQAAVRGEVAALTRMRPVVYHHADVDIRKMRQYAFPVSVREHAELNDTMLAHAVLHSEEEHTLEYLCREYGRLPAHKHLRKIAPVEYNAADVVQTVLVWEYGLCPELEADPAAARVYRRMSLPFLALAIEGEEAGIRVDLDTARALHVELTQKREQAVSLGRAYAGWPLNLNSSDQMKTVLYNVEGLPIQEKRAAFGAEGAVTVDKDAIAALRRYVGTEWDSDEPPTLDRAWQNIDAGGHPLLEARYLFMGAQQALSHYIEPCLEAAGGGGRIYPECRQHVQASGRHSYVGPAVQQMKGAMAEMLVPDPGTVWVGHDWSQIEVRILAVLANDEPYLAAFARGDDVHEINARAVFGPPGSPALEELRRRFIKAFAFRIHYRGKPENAGDIPGTRALGLDVPKLVAASERYLAAHPALPPYWAKVEDEAERTGLVRSFMGRPRRLTGRFRAQRAREACNHPMQAGVADVYVTTALLVKEAAPWARLVFGAHDAHWWQVPEDRVLEFVAVYAPIVQREFTLADKRTITFPASFKTKRAKGGDVHGAIG